MGVAEALYGTDAPAVCDVFRDGLTTAEHNDLLGNPLRSPVEDDHHGRRHLRAARGQTYCPHELAHYDEAVDDLDPSSRPMST